MGHRPISSNRVISHYSRSQFASLYTIHGEVVDLYLNLIKVCPDWMKTSCMVRSLEFDWIMLMTSNTLNFGSTVLPCNVAFLAYQNAQKDP